MSIRNFFNKKNAEKQNQESEDQKDKNKEQTLGEQKKEGNEGEKQQSDNSESEDVEYTKEDIKKIQNLFKEQDELLEKKDKQLEELEKSIKDLKTRLAYQLAENDNTVKRYRKQMEESKQFAISKFAKDILEVRDNLALALDHVDLEKINSTEDILLLKQQFENIVKGQKITTEVMDKILARFDVVQFNPLGEKFNPNLHDAVFMIKEECDHQNDHVGSVMMTGWKIGDRVLRAAKVGIVKK